MVPRVGLEPTHPHGHQILSLARLPIPPPRPIPTTRIIAGRDVTSTRCCQFPQGGYNGPMQLFLRYESRMLAPLMAVMGAGPLALALISQYGFGLHPCELCIWQRYPYLVLMALALIAWVWRGQMICLIRLCRIAACVWLLEAVLAAYHVGVEQGFWHSATGCSASGVATTDLDALRAAILNGPLVACDAPAFILFGLSMAGWNMIYAGFAAMLMLWLAGKHHRMSAIS